MLRKSQKSIKMSLGAVIGPLDLSQSKRKNPGSEGSSINYWSKWHACAFAEHLTALSDQPVRICGGGYEKSHVHAQKIRERCAMAMHPRNLARGYLTAELSGTSLKTDRDEGRKILVSTEYDKWLSNAFVWFVLTTHRLVGIAICKWNHPHSYGPYSHAHIGTKKPNVTLKRRGKGSAIPCLQEDNYSLSTAPLSMLSLTFLPSRVMWTLCQALSLSVRVAGSILACPEQKNRNTSELRTSLDNANYQLSKWVTYQYRCNVLKRNESQVLELLNTIPNS